MGDVFGVGEAIGGAAQAGAAIASAQIQADAIRDAQEIQAELFRENLAFQQGLFDTVRGDLTPFREFGETALDPLGGLLFGTGAEIQAQLEETPGFQFARDEALRASNAASSAAGLNLSGAQLKDLQDRAADVASQTLTQERQALFTAAGLGQASAAGTAAPAASLSAAGSSAFNNFSNASANLALARGSAFADLSTNLANVTSDLFRGDQSSTAFNSGGNDVSNFRFGPGFSDRRLKDNIEKIITRPDGVTIYRWTWNDKAKELFGYEGSAEGVIADEIEEIYPSAVAIHTSGYKTVDYSVLAYDG